MRLLQVRPPPPSPYSGSETQYLRYRLERIYKAPPGFREGEDVWVRYENCNSNPYDSTEVGGSIVRFANASQGELWVHYCSLSLPAYRPAPHELVDARRRWLESQP